ncbi:hypothetical protein ACIBHX_30915 [Nonomuraea sp. NPDC050536]|uniref:hypothetical protein n=1 Tax=Nonomuraea sp. NPDC050536 TaxID=3364366 RepID=UPI0037C6564D
MTASPRHWAFNPAPPPITPPDTDQDHTCEGCFPRAQQALIVAICRRVAGAGADVASGNWPLGGVEIWTREPGSGRPLDEGAAWVLHHKMARQLALVGWHTEVDARRVLVLGWSLSALRHRARMLQAALGRLTGFGPTAYRAATLTGDLLAGLCTSPSEFERDFVVDRTCALIARALRWPAWLAEIARYERTSQVQRMQLALAQIAGLERKLAHACQEHLALAARVSRAVCEDAAAGGSLERARLRALAEAQGWPTHGPDTRPATGAGSDAEPPQAGPMNLTERRVAASTPNHAVTAHRDPADLPQPGR